MLPRKAILFIVRLDYRLEFKWVPSFSLSLGVCNQSAPDLFLALITLLGKCLSSSHLKFFPTNKKDGGMEIRPILDLRNLNAFLHASNFHMVSTPSIFSVIKV